MAMFGEKELFLRDLAEVHLLFDFISGRSGRSLDQLSGKFYFHTRRKGEEPVANPGTPAVAPRESPAPSQQPPLTSQQVVEEICKIRYPPGNVVEVNAEQAAFMIVVKDKLNDLAFPARGLTIAFSSMFAGTALEPQTFCEYFASLWCFGALGKPSARGSKASPVKNPQKPDFIGSRRDGLPTEPLEPPSATTTSRQNQVPDEEKSSYSAVLAFPNLEIQARRFRRFYNRLPLWGALLVTVIAFLIWDCSVTTGLMSRIASAEHDRETLFSSDNRFIPTDVNCTAGVRPPGGADASTAPKPPDESTKAQDDQICQRARAVDEQEMSAQKNLRALAGTDNWLVHPVVWGVKLFTSNSVIIGPTTAVKDAVNVDTALQNNFNAVLSTLSTIITPLLFGWLGTLVAVARSITSKVRDSILAPRDFQIARVSTFLGMSAGLTVGLFYTPVDAGAALTKSLGGTISVSAATLSFLAGLGAEPFFTFLDSLIGRLFPATLSGVKDPAQQKTS